MHYIRFLKLPKVQVDKNNITLKAVVTITTDLGETFHPEDLTLVASLRSPDTGGEIYLRRKVEWTGSDGARSLPITLDLSRSDTDWPACLHVSAKLDNRQEHRGKPSADNFLPPILDVWSGLLNPTKGQFDSGGRVERRFTALSERQLSILEDAGDSIARHLWDGSLALTQHIDQTIALSHTTTNLPLLEYVLVSATYRRLHVLELGCGVGIVGLSLAQAIPDSDIILTDLPEASDIVHANIARMNAAINSKCAFQPLDWLDAPTLPDKLTTRTNDLIIVSECTYNTDTLQPLVQTLQALIKRSPKAVIVVATKTRHSSESAFFDMMAQAGFVDDGKLRIPLPGIPGQGYADSAADVGVHIFHGKEHRLSLSPRESQEDGVPKVRKRHEGAVAAGAREGKRRSWAKSSR
ncbi:hypothetical protein MBLNU230_g6130t1 [Neophaeotheca triangularis]